MANDYYDPTSEVGYLCNCSDCRYMPNSYVGSRFSCDRSANFFEGNIAPGLCETWTNSGLTNIYRVLPASKHSVIVR